MTVSSMFRTLIAITLAIVGLAACSDTTTANPDGGAINTNVSNATLTITAPLENGRVPIDSNHEIAIAFEVANFTLKPAGSCGGDLACGYAVLRVDGYTCNVPGQDYNNITSTNQVMAKLDLCQDVQGDHNFTIELRHDDGSVLRGAQGKAISQTVHMTAVPPPPELTITSPAQGDTVFVGLDPDQSVNIEFTMSLLTLESSPGGCGANPNCGILAVNIDGDDCNDPSAPAPVNNFGVLGSPIAAKFALCPTPLGPHTVTLTVFNDAGNAPLMVNGQPFTREVQVTAAALSGPIGITSPANGATLYLGTDADQSVPIGFVLQGITLEAFPGSGTCGSDPNCGVLAVNIDGDDCDDPDAGAPANNFGALTSPINALFAKCATPTGAHTVTLTVINDSASGPVMVGGDPVTAEINVTTQAPPSVAITSPSDGATVTLGGDADKTVPIAFVAQNLTFEPFPGSGGCTGIANCGVLVVNIDGDACNDPDAPGPVNNLNSGSSPIDAHFVHCSVPTGAHTVTVTVIDDTGDQPVMVNGQPLISSIHITTQ